MICMFVNSQYKYAYTYFLTWGSLCCFKTRKFHFHSVSDFLISLLLIYQAIIWDDELTGPVGLLCDMQELKVGDCRLREWLCFRSVNEHTFNTHIAIQVKIKKSTVWFQFFSGGLCLAYQPSLYLQYRPRYKIENTKPREVSGVLNILSQILLCYLFEPSITYLGDRFTAMCFASYS